MSFDLYSQKLEYTPMFYLHKLNVNVLREAEQGKILKSRSVASVLVLLGGMFLLVKLWINKAGSFSFRVKKIFKELSHGAVFFSFFGGNHCITLTQKKKLSVNFFDLNSKNCESTEFGSLAQTKDSDQYPSVLCTRNLQRKLLGSVAQSFKLYSPENGKAPLLITLGPQICVLKVSAWPELILEDLVAIDKKYELAFTILYKICNNEENRLIQPFPSDKVMQPLLVFDLLVKGFLNYSLQRNDSSRSQSDWKCVVKKLVVFSSKFKKQSFTLKNLEDVSLLEGYRQAYYESIVESIQEGEIYDIEDGILIHTLEYHSRVEDPLKQVFILS